MWSRIFGRSRTPSTPGAHEKDWLENQMHKEVCSGRITLSEAQQEIKADWYAAYLKRTQPK